MTKRDDWKDFWVPPQRRPAAGNQASRRTRHGPTIGSRRLASLFVIVIIVAVLSLAQGLAKAELGNTLENFHAKSPFTQRFGFVYTDSYKLPCPAGLGLTEPKYSYGYRYRHAAVTENPSQLNLKTLGNPRTIGEQTLSIAARRGPNDTQMMFLRTLIEESTNGAIKSAVVAPKIVSFVEQSYARFYHTGQREFETLFVEGRFGVEMRTTFEAAFAQLIMKISLPDAKQRVPCAGD